MYADSTTPGGICDVSCKVAGVLAGSEPIHTSTPVSPKLTTIMGRDMQPESIKATGKINKDFINILSFSDSEQETA